MLASQGTALSATGRGIHTQCEKEGTEMTDQEGKCSINSNICSRRSGSLAPVGGRMDLEAGKREDGEGMERELPKAPCPPCQASSATCQGNLQVLEGLENKDEQFLNCAARV